VAIGVVDHQPVVQPPLLLDELRDARGGGAAVVVEDHDAVLAQPRPGVVEDVLGPLVDVDVDVDQPEGVGLDLVGGVVGEDALQQADAVGDADAGDELLDDRLGRVVVLAVVVVGVLRGGLDDALPRVAQVDRVVDAELRAPPSARRCRRARRPPR
jgi:hypothetical protein